MMLFRTNPICIPLVLAGLLLFIVPACSKQAATNSQAVGSADEKFSRSMLEPGSIVGSVLTDDGQGPGMGGDKFDVVDDNPFQLATQTPLSTFSIDVDTASYAKIRSYLFEQGQRPRKDTVRIEELVNYFDYSYPSPGEAGPHPISAGAEVTDCPWNDNHKLARIAMRARDASTERTASKNLVFLIDVSGSMNRSNKLPLLKQSLAMLAEQLAAQDRVSIVVYAGAAGVVLDGASGDRPRNIINALAQLQAGGSTNGGAGIMRAYALARQYFIEGGDNRVILCSDGDFNVGNTGTDTLVRMIEEQASTGVYLTVLGFGMGNHNDAMLEQISGRGDGNYFFIDSIREAEKVLVKDMQATLTTVAEDVKIQVEFNPGKVAAYRLIGYENRLLAAEDFNDDQKDAGEVGAGHCVTALYEIVPTGIDLPKSIGSVDPLKYQLTSGADETSVSPPASQEWLTVKVRYKLPGETESQKFEVVAQNESISFEEAGNDVRFAAAVASFGMLLRESPHRGDSSFDKCLAIAESARGEDPFGFRGEFCELVRIAMQL